MGNCAISVHTARTLGLEVRSHASVATKALRGRVLVVDDENGPRQALRLLLNEDHDVFLASSVEAARQIFYQEPIELVITDVRMPQETGVDLLQWVKTNYPDTEVIILTGYGELQSAKEAVTYGAFAYLEKPFDNDEMLKYVHEALAKRQREEQRRQLEELALEANRFETLGHFVSGMLHDLGSPLSVIGSHIDLILQSRPEPQIGNRLSIVQAQAEHCRGIIRSAMGFLQHPTSQFVDLNLNEVFENCRVVAQPLLAKEGVEVKCELAPDAPMCRGDFVLVRQAVLNLVTNACQALSGLKTPRRITVRTYRREEWICLSVEDTGPGIPPEQREDVFKAFYTTKGEAGTGLGLVAVRNVMHRHKGEVELLDSEQGGALFVLKFPVKRFDQSPVRRNS